MPKKTIASQPFDRSVKQDIENQPKNEKELPKKQVPITKDTKEGKTFPGGGISTFLGKKRNGGPKKAELGPDAGTEGGRGDLGNLVWRGGQRPYG